MTNLSRRNFILGSLGVIGIFGIGGCANKSTISKDELLSGATEADWAEIYEELSNNEARGLDEWNGKTVRMILKAMYIEDDYFKGCGLFSNELDMTNVYLTNRDELVSLNKGWQVVVVGILDLEHFNELNNAYILEASEPAIDTSSFVYTE